MPAWLLSSPNTALFFPGKQLPFASSQLCPGWIRCNLRHDKAASNKGRKAGIITWELTIFNSCNEQTEQDGCLPNDRANPLALEGIP